MERELSHWAVPIAQPNEFESERPSILKHLPPLSVDEVT